MTQQLACAYAALILQERGQADAESLRAVAAAAGVTVSPCMAAAFAQALAGADVAALLGNVNFAGGAAPARAAASSAEAAAPAAEKEKAKEEKPVEEDDDEMGFNLFD